MTVYKVSHSLHNNWLWFMKLEDKPKQEFLDKLLKIDTPKTEAMITGQDFEDAVMCEATGVEPDKEHPGSIEVIRELADIVRGGLWQQRVEGSLDCGRWAVYLTGVIDNWHRDTLYDIKWTSNYEIGKFEEIIQQKIYMYLTGIKKFSYLISDGRSWWREDYFWTPNMVEDMKMQINEMLDSIMLDKDFRLAYLENWQYKPEQKKAS